MIKRGSMAQVMTRKPFNPDLIRPDPQRQPSTARNPISVSQLTGQIKLAIETALPTTVYVVGEISNFKQHSSGHLYFTLKDSNSELSCVMWRSAAASLKFQPTDGMEVIATGSVEVFERAGRYQLYARKLEPRGVGALELAFRQLQEKLEKEGLFDDERKQSLPVYPTTLALVTSPTGAALTDMVRTIERRYPCVRLLIYPVRVQGEGAAKEIAGAIQLINRHQESLGGVDAMIVGRGGGSIEDLWAFNEEVVARAIFKSRIPVISAVGHEVDVTIADLVADVRAATPTAAAELAVPVLSDLIDSIEDQSARFSRAVLTKLALQTFRLELSAQKSFLREPLLLVHRREQVVDEWTNRMTRALRDRLSHSRLRLENLDTVLQRIAPHTQLTHHSIKLYDLMHRLRWALHRRFSHQQAGLIAAEHQLHEYGPLGRLPQWQDRVNHDEKGLITGMNHRLRLDGEQLRRQHDRLLAMGYKSVLNRGFSITRMQKGKSVIRSVKQLKDRQRLTTQVSDGQFETEVVNLNQLELFD